MKLKEKRQFLIWNLFLFEFNFFGMCFVASERCVFSSADSNRLTFIPNRIHAPQSQNAWGNRKRRREKMCCRRQGQWNGATHIGTGENQAQQTFVRRERSVSEQSQERMEERKLREKLRSRDIVWFGSAHGMNVLDKWLLKAFFPQVFRTMSHKHKRNGFSTRLIYMFVCVSIPWDSSA